MKNAKTIAKTTFTILLLVIGVYGLTSSAYSIIKSLIIPNEAFFHTSGVEAYWDAAKTQPISSIDWGWFYAGNSAQKTLYVYNPGNTELQLSLTVSNVVPAEVQEFFIVSWDLEGFRLPGKSTQQCTLTFTRIADSQSVTVEHLTFDIIVNGAEV